MFVQFGYLIGKRLTPSVGYKWLYNEARILHRDISLNNLMYYRDHDNHKIYGVLNDFDLSHQMTGKHPHPGPASTKQRTGTLPFMAIDFFYDTPVIHGYRHDLESFMWVMLFHIGQYRDGKSVGLSGPYHTWLLDNRDVLLNRKVAIQNMVHFAQAQAAFAPLLRWINKMIGMFDKGGRAIRDHIRDDPQGEFAVESSGGYITLDGFEAILMM
jgi:serine/threonine protein kinase